MAQSFDPKSFSALHGRRVETWYLACMNEGNPIETLQPVLLRQAYYLTGSLTDSEDIVQEAYLKWMAADTQSVINPHAYLKRLVVNLAINWKRRQALRRADYYGEWLPEPMAMERADAGIESHQMLSYSLLVLLERLNAKERAVFILKEAFDYDHEEIAEVLDITPANSRQLLRRARLHIKARPNARVPQEEQTEFLDRFRRIIQIGDTAELETLLRDDVVAVSDGGGKASAGKHPVTGRTRVARMLVGLYHKFYREISISRTVICGQPAWVCEEGNAIRTCLIFTLREGKLQEVFLIRNPDKLSALQKNRAFVSRNAPLDCLDRKLC